MAVEALLAPLFLASLTAAVQDPDLEPLLLLRDRLRSIQSLRAIAERRDEGDLVRFRTTYVQGPLARVWRHRMQVVGNGPGGFDTMLDAGWDGERFWRVGMEEADEVTIRDATNLPGACFADFFCRAWAMPLVGVLDRRPTDREIPAAWKEEGLVYHTFDLPEAGETYAVALGFAEGVHRPLQHLLLLRDGRRGVGLLVTDWKEHETIGPVPAKGQRRTYGEDGHQGLEETWVFSTVEFDVELEEGELGPPAEVGGGGR